jgi:hypothetical protein
MTSLAETASAIYNSGISWSLINMRARVFTAVLPAIVSLLALLVTWWILCLVYGHDYDKHENIFNILSNIVTICAIMAGAIWTYQGFIRQRIYSQKLNIKQSLEILELPEGHHLLKIKCILTNIGQTRVRIKQWRMYAEEILPMKSATEQLMISKKIFCDDDAEWEIIANNGKPGFDIDVDLEPGETDKVYGNIFVPRGSTIIQVYSHFPNKDKKDDHGWTSLEIVDLQQSVSHQRSKRNE